MAESGPDNQSSASGSPVAEFGDNAWLVDEMFERYQDDPASVDKAWLAYFEGRSDAASDAEDEDSDDEDSDDEDGDAGDPESSADDSGADDTDENGSPRRRRRRRWGWPRR